MIPTRPNETQQDDFDREAYRGRNVVKRCENWMKENRWPGTRYEKLAVNFLAMARLAMIRRYFSVLDLSDRP